MKRLRAQYCFWIATSIALILSAKSRAASETKTIANRVTEFEKAAGNRLAPWFHQAKIEYPPQRVVLIGLKSKQRLELWAGPENGELKWIHTYPILAASGTSGPKLREGDQQVPEGFYQIASLNPNSRFHLALRVNYPSDFDRARAREDHRENLGGDIMIHGNRVSIGCLAMGDEAAEDLFVLAAKTGLKNVRVILTPVDFRAGETVEARNALPQWTHALYQQLKVALEKFRREE